MSSNVLETLVLHEHAERVGQVHVEGENSMAMSGLGCENPFSSILGANGPRKESFTS